MNLRLPSCLLVLYLFAAGCDSGKLSIPSGNTTAAPAVAAPVERARGTSAPFEPAPMVEELRIDAATGEELVHALRAACEERAFTAPRLAALHAPLVAVLYSGAGERLDMIRQEAGALDELALNAGRTLCRVTNETDVYLHGLIVTYTARFPNFGTPGLFDNKVFEPQVTGLAYELGGDRFELDPLEQLERNMGTNDSRRGLNRRAGLTDKEMLASNDLILEMYRTAHYGERYPDRVPARFFRGHLALGYEDVDHELLADRIGWIANWHRANVVDGEVVYEYSVARRKYRNERRTMVRSAMAAWILNRLAFALDDDELKRLGREVIEHYFESYYQMTKSKEAGRLMPAALTLPTGNTVVKRWTAASFIAGAARERADKAEFRQEMDLLMEWAMSHQRDDGIFRTDFGRSQYFMPGHLLLIVSYFYRDTGDERYKAYLDKSMDVYDPVLRQMMYLGKEWHTPYAPAWFTQPLTQMYLETGEDKYRDLIFAINDRVLHAYDINARYQVYPDYDGMLAPKPNSYGNNSVTAASLESLTDAAVVARAAGDLDRYERYRHVVRRTVAFLLRLQYIPENTYYFPHRERALGGFKRDMLDSTLWMDNVWHLTSAFLKIQEHRLLD